MKSFYKIIFVNKRNYLHSRVSVHDFIGLKTRGYESMTTLASSIFYGFFVQRKKNCLIGQGEQDWLVCWVCNWLFGPIMG